MREEIVEIREAVSGPVTSSEDEEETSKANEAQEALQNLVAWLSEPATVEIKEETDERILLEIHGDKTGLLIGKRGQTLDALQFLVNKMVNRSGDSAKRIEVDMEQYRKRREQALQNMAVRLGQKVKKKRKPITIEAMNAHDRRIVHLTLKNDRALETKSVGKGEMRKLVIHPVNGGRSKRHEGSGAAS
jgi:spoIIIJ-associated protein